MITQEIKDKIWEEIKVLPIIIQNKNDGIIAMIEDGKAKMNYDFLKNSCDYYLTRIIDDEVYQRLKDNLGISLKEAHDIVFELCSQSPQLGHSL